MTPLNQDSNTKSEEKSEQLLKSAEKRILSRKQTITLSDAAKSFYWCLPVKAPN